MANSLNHTRRLVAALIVSGTLNISLLALIFYWSQQENQLASYCSLSPVAEQLSHPIPLVATHHTNSEVIRHMKTLPVAQLRANLANKEPVEDGYTRRDLALAVLTTFHHFDLDRALSGYAPVLQRRLAYGKYRDGRTAELTVYPGLSDKQYASIMDFAAIERWPLSSKGLFLAMKSCKDDPSLLDAFYMTPEFAAAEALFGTSPISPDRHELLEMLMQGEWSMLADLLGNQRSLQDLSGAKRQGVLLDYIQKGSRAAAYLLLKSDADFALRRLDDSQVMQLLQLLDEQRDETQNFALALLSSPRTDAVWKEAVECLYRCAGESVPEKCHRQTVLARFVPQSIKEVPVCQPVPAPSVEAVVAAKPQAAPVPPVVKPSMKPMSRASVNKDNLYIVQEGDSLWKISRRFNVDVACLKSHNRLDSDLLRPGKSLRIPKR